MSRSRLLLVALGAFWPVLLSSCSRDLRKDPSLQDRVSQLVDETTKSDNRRAEAVWELVALGDAAVPYLIGHLGDVRPLMGGQISLENKSPSSFEAVRHYSPDTVHDALAAVLNQVTGQTFLFVYNGSSPEERQINWKLWVEWCEGAVPEKSQTCRSGQ